MSTAVMSLASHGSSTVEACLDWRTRPIAFKYRVPADFLDAMFIHVSLYGATPSLRHALSYSMNVVCRHGWQEQFGAGDIPPQRTCEGVPE